MNKSQKECLISKLNDINKKILNTELELILFNKMKKNTKCDLNKIQKKHNIDLNINCNNNAKHSDGHNNYCTDCWNRIEFIYPDSDLI